MKTKFKDFLLYSLACVGAVSLFLSAYQPQETTSTVPESHVWEGYVPNSDVSYFYSLNKETGEVRHTSSLMEIALTFLEPLGDVSSNFQERFLLSFLISCSDQ